MQYSYIFLLLFCIPFALCGQQTPAPPQTQAILVRGATAHLGNGQVIENAFVAFENGKILFVADARTINIESDKNYKIIDATGLHLYPGFISLNTNLGLVEIGQVRATRDSREVGRMNPHIRSIIAYNTDSRVTPTVRSNGTLLAQIVPEGGRISGQSSIVELDAWNWEDAAYKTDDGIHLNWPSIYRFTGWWAEPGEILKNKKYDQQVNEILEFFQEAKVYKNQKNRASKNLKFEAMRGLFDQSKQLFIHTQNAKTIMESILFAEQFGIKCVIVGGRDSWMISDFLREHQVPVVINEVHSLPRRVDDDIDQPFKTAATLQEAGVLFAFSMNGAWQQRNLPFQAGQAVAFGLDYEAAISGLSLNAAKILGIDQTVGSIEEGKDATFILVKGDVLDMRTCIVAQAFIRGKAIDLDNKQKALYRKFKAKYDQE
ncbi:MAG: amidohydrolase family protein [Bacteroidota bacterium]